MPEDFYRLILDILQEAGEIAVSIQRDVKFFEKEDLSPVSEADLRITELTYHKLKDLLKTDQHILLDEETISESSNNYSSQGRDGDQYIWTLDPIGGTSSYINQMPLYGIYLGLLKNNKPYMGGVYLPALNELFVSDDKKSYFISFPFSKDAKTKEIEPIVTELGSQNIIFCSRTYASDVCMTMDPYTQAAALCWPLIGRGVGAASRPYLWDIAGAWPIFERAGFYLFDSDSGKKITEFNSEYFDSNLRLRKYLILSTEKNFERLKNGISTIKK